MAWKIIIYIPKNIYFEYLTILVPHEGEGYLIPGKFWGEAGGGGEWALLIYGYISKKLVQWIWHKQMLQYFWSSFWYNQY